MLFLNRKHRMILFLHLFNSSLLLLNPLLRSNNKKITSQCHRHLFSNKTIILLSLLLQLSKIMTFSLCLLLHLQDNKIRIFNNKTMKSTSNLLSTKKSPNNSPTHFKCQLNLLLSPTNKTKSTNTKNNPNTRIITSNQQCNTRAASTSTTNTNNPLNKSNSKKCPNHSTSTNNPQFNSTNNSKMGSIFSE